MTLSGDQDRSLTRWDFPFLDSSFKLATIKFHPLVVSAISAVVETSAARTGRGTIPGTAVYSLYDGLIFFTFNQDTGLLLLPQKAHPHHAPDREWSSAPPSNPTARQPEPTQSGAKNKQGLSMPNAKVAKPVATAHAKPKVVSKVMSKVVVCTCQSSIANFNQLNIAKSFVAPVRRLQF
jgi:hypothetical protein